MTVTETIKILNGLIKSRDTIQNNISKSKKLRPSEKAMTIAKCENEKHALRLAIMLIEYNLEQAGKTNVG